MDISELAELKPDYLLEHPVYPEVPKGENPRVGTISREVDRAWLAGIIDGEGNINACEGRRLSGGVKKVYFTPAVRITNTDVRMIKKISEIYAGERIIFNYAINAVSRYKNRKPTWKDQLEISVGNPTNVTQVLKLALPYLVSKRRYAEIMLELLVWINGKPARGRYSKGDRYTDLPEYYAYLQSLKNERAGLIPPSTTIRRAREVLSW